MKNDTIIPKVTFIIPCYNVEKYVEACISSISKQSYQNLEIIPVNDGSQDSTGIILDRISHGDNRIKVLHKSNGGVSSARNIGIRIATGDYIVFVDGDDYIAEDYTHYMISLVEKNNADMALSINCYMHKGEQQIKADSISCLTSEEATMLLLGPKVVVGCWNKIFKRSLLVENHIRFSHSQFYGEGLLFITTASQCSAKIAVGKRKVYFYRRNNSSSACTQFNIQNFYNGAKSIDMIEESLRIKSNKLINMLHWHRCQFNMGSVVRMIEAGKEKEYQAYYRECLTYVRKHTWNCLLLKGVSLYKKLLLIGTCICPWLMATMDMVRRKKIQDNSII